MTLNALIQILVYFGVLFALALPLGRYAAAVLAGHRTWLSPVLLPLERACYRLGGVDPQHDMSWRSYASALLVFSALGFVLLYALLRLQGWLPLNSQGLPGVPAPLAFNTAVSFVTNTNWQAYGGETTLSQLSQMLGLTVQNFFSAAAGIAVLAALARGFARREAGGIGNFWVDLTRASVHLLLPLSLLLALALASQGVVQTLASQATAAPLDPSAGTAVQQIALGPAASQVAIKQLGTNGGGFFNVNSAHPLENPTAASNFLQMLAILLLPAALCIAFGRLVGRPRDALVLLAAMTLIYLAALAATLASEQAGTPALAAAGAELTASADSSGGNMQGKEVRFGIVNSALWATATTAASNGSVNSMHDAYTPLGGMLLLWLMQLGEVVYGGVGSGLYGMLMFAVIAVFVAGLMVGRTPEYLGKKLEGFEIKMAVLAVLVPALGVLVGVAIACLHPATGASLANPLPHGFSELLYAFSSAANNNGSAFAGFAADTVFFNTALGLAMLCGRFWPMLAVIAVAGALARKKGLPVSAGTLATDTPLFTGLLIGTVLVVGALAFLPALAAGPIIEQLLMSG